MPICAVSVAEDELRGLVNVEGAMKVLAGHLAAWNYFQSIDTPKNKEFVEKFKKYTKDDKRVTDDPIEAAYFQVYFWAEAVKKAGSTDVDKVREAVRGIEFDAPGGKVKVGEKNQHTFKPFLMGEILEDGQFKIVHETGPDRARPVPADRLPRQELRLDQGRRHQGVIARVEPRQSPSAWSIRDPPLGASGGGSWSAR